ncbi:MAG TPA: retropepsin-like aspartic protease, partial [Caulobacteraceae bacterium]|nr:retropepsin-like aspartic protease [Caulobacteraceae bacterium]
MRERLAAFALTVLALLAGPGPSDAGECNLQKIAELPVTMSGMEAMVSAQINGQDARFFIDTGAFFSMLSPASAAKFGLKLGPIGPGIRISGVTGEADMHVTTVKTLTFLGAPFHDVQFLVGEHGIGQADGLLGQNALGGIDAEYDLANGVVRLFYPKGCGGADLAYWAPSGEGVGVLPIEPMVGPDRRLIGTATLNGVKIRVKFDSGASRSVLSIEGARRAGVKLDGPGVVQIGGSASVGARMARSWIAPFQSFEIGGEQVKATRLRIADIQLTDADMLLGADFFLSHHIYIARSQNRIYFTYNGGPVFNLEGPRPPAPLAPPPSPQAQANAQAAGALGGAPPAAPADSAEGPKDAAGFARRAAA